MSLANEQIASDIFLVLSMDNVRSTRSFSMSPNVSCGGDDDNNEPEEPKAVAYYDVKYVTELGEDWFDFFDVAITYVNIAGKETTEPIEMNTVFSTKIEAAMAPNTINFRIHVTRKASHPSVDPDQRYHFAGNAQVWVQAYLKDNTRGNCSGDLIPASTRGTTISGKDMEKFLDRYNNADIFDHSVELKK